MKPLENIKQKHAVVFCLFIAVASLFLMIVGSYVAALASIWLGESYYTLVLVQEIFAIGFLLLLAWASNTLYPLTRRGAGLGHAMQVAAYPMVLIITLAISMAAYGAERGDPLQPVGQIIIFVLSMLSIGLVEELAFRAIIAETLIKHYGTSYAATWKAATVSGLIFGMAHITNIFGASLLGVFVQMTVAVVLGMLFAAIYYRTGNLWICVLLHAGINGASLLDSGLYGEGTITEMVSSFSLVNLTPCITYGIPLIFLLRRKKNTEVQFWFGDNA